MPSRWGQIDALRALAVFLVLGRHMAVCPRDTSPFLHWLSGLWARGGWVGVDLFFVLSGFLVSGLLFREHRRRGSVDVKRFLIRRGFKIYPPFWLLIGLSPLLLATLRDVRVPFGPLLSELLFVQNYRRGIWGHTWSLAVEEHFYFLLALGLWLLARRKVAEPFRLVPASFALAAVGCLLARLRFAATVPSLRDVHLAPTHLRLDALLFGVFLAYLYDRRPAAFTAWAERRRGPLVALGALGLLPAFLLELEATPFVFTGGLTLFYLSSGGLLVAALGSKEPHGRLPRAIAFVGSRSYSIYLWHLPFLILVPPLVGPRLGASFTWGVYWLFCLAGTTALGVGAALLVEQPSLGLRDRLFPSRGPSPLGVTAGDGAPSEEAVVVGESPR